MYTVSPSIGRAPSAAALALHAALAIAVSAQQAPSVPAPPAPAPKASPAAPAPRALLEGQILPEVEIQAADYAAARKQFTTKLLKERPAPGRVEKLTLPEGVTEVEFTSGTLKLKAWLAAPKAPVDQKLPAVLFLHGGFAFGVEDWDMTKPFRDAGFVVMVPLLRGENGQPGAFSLFYNEVDDVLAAADFLAKQPNVDPKQLNIAGHSVGGTLTLLAAMASPQFHAAASFSASPDQVIYCKVGIPEKLVPFDTTNPREFQMRSPMSYAASLKCPTRMYFGSREPHFQLSTERTTQVAKEHKLDVESAQVEGGHESAVPEEMKRSIEFFKRK